MINLMDTLHVVHPGDHEALAALVLQHCCGSVGASDKRHEKLLRRGQLNEVRVKFTHAHKYWTEKTSVDVVLLRPILVQNGYVQGRVLAGRATRAFIVIFEVVPPDFLAELQARSWSEEISRGAIVNRCSRHTPDAGRSIRTLRVDTGHELPLTVSKKYTVGVEFTHRAPEPALLHNLTLQAVREDVQEIAKLQCCGLRAKG
jgi:hypothetical protein